MPTSITIELPLTVAVFEETRLIVPKPVGNALLTVMVPNGDGPKLVTVTVKVVVAPTCDGVAVRLAPIVSAVMSTVKPEVLFVGTGSNPRLETVAVAVPDGEVASGVATTRMLVD